MILVLLAAIFFILLLASKSKNDKASLTAGSCVPSNFPHYPCPEGDACTNNNDCATGNCEFGKCVASCAVCQCDHPTIWPFTGCDISCGAKCGDGPCCYNIGATGAGLDAADEAQEEFDDAEDKKSEGDLGSDLGAPEVPESWLEETLGLIGTLI